MDKKIETYQNIITSILKDYADSFNQTPKSIEAKLVFDYERRSFQVLNIGWRNGEYFFYVVFHLDIRNDKVWLNENRTDILIAQMLVEHGIPTNNIVLGLQSPETRVLSGYDDRTPTSTVSFSLTSNSATRPLACARTRIGGCSVVKTTRHATVSGYLMR